MSPARKEPDLSTYSGRMSKMLRAQREAAGLSVPEAAQKVAKLNKSPRKPPAVTTYYGWEDGSGAPHPDLYPAIARALKLKSVHDIMPKK